MDRHLASQPFFVAQRYSIADIALYAYTHVAEEAQIDLAPFGAVRAWLARVAQQSGHVPLMRRPP
jgi:glutathione S-transferase